MGIQELIVAIIGVFIIYTCIRKITRIVKGKENPCSCCDKSGCGQCHLNNKENTL